MEEPENHWTVTNALDVYTPEGEVTQITAVKKWAVPEIDATVKPDVTFQLQYRFADDPSAVWTNADYYISDAMQIANEGNNWTVVWENLPLTIEGQTVTYQVIEQLPGDSEWIQISQPVQTFSGGKATYTFYNTQIRSFSVEKKWNPATAVTHEVTVWLYRTTDSSAVGSVNGDRVPLDEMNPSDYRTATLNSENSWRATFENLPKYDAGGNLYYYYALEADGDTPVADGGGITLGTDPDSGRYVVSYETNEDNTTVTNTPATSISGTKTWKDNSNEGNTRPSTLTLILERTTNGTDWETVTDKTPTWDNTDADVWTCPCTTDRENSTPTGCWKLCREATNWKTRRMAVI